MPSYSYSAINDKGRKIRGQVAADNEFDLETRLRQIGLDLVAAREVLPGKVPLFGRIKAKDLIVFAMHLEQLDRAGVPLHDALADVRDSTESPRLRDVLTGVFEAVKNGNMLSQALASYPDVFNEVFIGLVNAGEKTGHLAASFAHIAEHLKWTSDLKRRVAQAVRYPLVLLVAVAAVVATMMMLVVPRLVDFILSQGFELPWHTRALIGVAYAFEHYWYLMLGLPLLLFGGLVFFYRSSSEFAYNMDSLLLRLPLIGPVVRKTELARFTHFFSVMFTSGIEMLDALETASGVVRNHVLKDAVLLVKNHVAEGNSLTVSLRLSNQFPSLVIRMFKVGEDSGNMKAALENVNFFYNREVADSVDGMIGAIQPLLTVVMGVLIFWIIAAIFGPLYESFGRIEFWEQATGTWR